MWCDSSYGMDYFFLTKASIVFCFFFGGSFSATEEALLLELPFVVLFALPLAAALPEIDLLIFTLEIVVFRHDLIPQSVTVCPSLA